MKNLLEIAARKKYRFPTRKGNASFEDLWDLSLSSLDKIANTLDASLSSKSFIGKEVSEKEDLEKKLEIVKYVIDVKLREGRNELPPETRKEIKFL